MLSWCRLLCAGQNLFNYRLPTLTLSFGVGLLAGLVNHQPAFAVQLTAGPNNEFVFDTDNSVTGVTFLLGAGNDVPHDHTPFTADPDHNIGALVGGESGRFFAMGEPPFGPYSQSLLSANWSDRPGGKSLLVNGPGLDLYVFESGNADNIDTLALRAVGDQKISDFFYEKPINFTPTASLTEGYWTFGYDLSWLGFEQGESVEEILLANFSPLATVNPIPGFVGTGNRGFVDFSGSTGERIEGGLGDRFLGTTTQICGLVTDAPGPNVNSYYFSWCNPGFENFDTDPDLVYIVAAGDAVFEVPAVSEPGQGVSMATVGMIGLTGTIFSTVLKLSVSLLGLGSLSARIGRQ
ncbi:MAG: hypothetical protein AAGF24_05240 [Cyanobacteria bacterium P01_H01_bin.121]